jgi:hypothetical protein
VDPENSMGGELRLAMARPGHLQFYETDSGKRSGDHTSGPGQEEWHGTIDSWGRVDFTKGEVGDAALSGYLSCQLQRRGHNALISQDTMAKKREFKLLRSRRQILFDQFKMGIFPLIKAL